MTFVHPAPLLARWHMQSANKLLLAANSASYIIFTMRQGIPIQTWPSVEK